MTLDFYKISARLDSEKLRLKTTQMEGVNLEKMLQPIHCLGLQDGSPEEKTHNHSGYSADT